MRAPAGAAAADADAGAYRSQASTPDLHAAMTPLAHELHQRAKKARHHKLTKGKSIEAAQDAAIVPRTQHSRDAATAAVHHLDDAQPTAETKKLNKEAFKETLTKAINEEMTKARTKAEAEEVMDNGAKKASTKLSASLQKTSAATTADLREAARSSGEPGGQQEGGAPELHPEAAGTVPAPVDAAPATPQPLPAEKLDYSSDRAPTDQMMAENQVTNDQMKEGNDPAFGPALSARADAEQHEAAAGGEYRRQEAAIRANAAARAKDTAHGGLTGLHGVRVRELGGVAGHQHGVRAVDMARRAAIMAEITGIKTRTQADVTRILDEMDQEALRIFEAGVKTASDGYESAFSDVKGGLGNWLANWGSDWEELIERALASARGLYRVLLGQAIDKIAEHVERQLRVAQERVRQGLSEIDRVVNSQEGEMRHFADQAREAVGKDFTALETQIDSRAEQLINRLSDQLKAAYSKMQAREEELREANKSLWRRVYDATVGAIKKIIEFKNLLFSVLAKAASVVLDIIAHPIRFLGNLVSAVGGGLKNFIKNIGTHLQKGLMEWLFGALAGAGLKLPEKFDLQGIISIVLQILGLTYENFRARAVNILGEEIVKGLETAAEVFLIFMKEGVSGIWRFIKDKVSDLKSMVLDAIFEFIKEKVITAGITWIIGLLNPVSAFFKACKAIYDIIVFIVNRAQQIVEFVSAVVDSVAAIVAGNLGAAIAAVENALAKAIPVAIGMLASLLGLGDPSKPVKETIAKAQAPVNKAIDWVIHGAVKVVKAAGKFVKGLFGEREKDKKTTHEDDPEKSARIAAAIAEIHRLEQEREQGGHLSHESAESIVRDVRSKHKVFTSLKVTMPADHWIYHYTASAEETIDDAPVQMEIRIEVGTEIVLIGTEEGKKRVWPASVTKVVPEQYIEYSGPGGKRHSYNVGRLSFGSYRKSWRLVESKDDLKVQDHHKIPWENQRHINHPLRVLSEANLFSDKRNLMQLGGHAGNHSVEYHEEVNIMMTTAYSRLSSRTQQSAHQAIGDVMAQIEQRIASGVLKPYRDKAVWIP